MTNNTALKIEKNLSKISIRPLEENDAKTSFEWRNRTKIWKYTVAKPQENPTLEDEIEWIKKVLAKENDYRFAIMVGENYVGNTYLTDVNDHSAKAHIFIGDPHFGGSEVAFLASTLIHKFGKETLKLKTLEVEVHKDNLSVIKLCTKMGYEKTVSKGEKIYMAVKL